MTISGTTEANILRKLHNLQYGEKSLVLLFSQDPTGLGGQITRRIVGLRLALLYGRKVVFPFLTEPPYGQVFEPLHSAINYGEALAAAAPFTAESLADAQIVHLDFWDMWSNVALRDSVYGFLPPKCASARHPRNYFEGMLLSFCKLIPAHAQMVDDMAQKLDVDEETLGVHIRRGDKSAESPYVPMEAINIAIATLCATGKFRKIFACSDSPSVFDEIIVPPGIVLVYDKDEKRYNNANHRFLMRNPDMAEQETSTAIKNIFLLGRCGAIIGQTNAHFVEIAAAQICYRKSGEDYGILIDGHYALKRSRILRIYHTMKSAAREVVRRIFPSVTLRYTKRRFMK